MSMYSRRAGFGTMKQRMCEGTLILPIEDIVEDSEAELDCRFSSPGIILDARSMILYCKSGEQLGRKKIGRYECRECRYMCGR